MQHSAVAPAAPANPSVTARALQVLESFTTAHPVLRLADISRHAGLPLTTTHRLVKELADWGALERDPDGGYRIGLRLWEIASLAPRGLGLREVALPHLSDLCHLTRENVQLAVREDLSVVYVERLAGRHAVRVLTRVGGRFELTPTGVGLVLLAHAPGDVQERALARPPHRHTERTLTTPHDVRRALAEVRRTGVAVSDRQVTMDAVSVAAPVHGPGDTVVAAVSVVAHADTVRPHALAPLVTLAARDISRALGARLAPVAAAATAGPPACPAAGGAPGTTRPSPP
ncbi:IclR family transcriptional regulator [Streptomyces sp. JV176]|uniref:IclR family transcriptional regulator n=1 Tax=Streptomyces sp. JV176 TaxID=858630 RepID=UPI002E776BDC|nr:IclR family transcriptional regulator [Streptomyces sp. JV176]MEE1800639.1 IclR family transcriptional regulator [Streptomyces sp. JV176]